jgi:hypothetical protein
VPGQFHRGLEADTRIGAGHQGGTTLLARYVGGRPPSEHDASPIIRPTTPILAPPAADVALLQGFPDASVEINEQLAERDLVATRKTLRGTHLGELWDLPPTGNRVELEFIDIFRLRDGRLIEHWTSMDINALRQQMHPAP